MDLFFLFKQLSAREIVKFVTVSANLEFPAQKGAPRLKYPRGNTRRSERLSDIGANNTRNGGSVVVGSDMPTPMYRGRPCMYITRLHVSTMSVMGRGYP